MVKYIVPDEIKTSVPIIPSGLRSAPAFDKYYYYSEAVQQPDEDVLFYRTTFKALTGKTPKVIREDFCGTFKICCEWAKLGPDYVAHGLDLDPEPMSYGRQHYLPALTPDQRSRINIYKQDVLDPGAPKADMVLALNFSYFLFKKREDLKRYFTNCFKTINEGGVLLIDCFGGMNSQEQNVETTDYPDFTYYWDQKNYDFISHEARFGIHFKLKDGTMKRDVFTYDWRVWTIPELRELMAEAGFRKSHVYLEGGDGEEGNGIFTREEEGDDSEAWIGYLIAEK